MMKLKIILINKRCTIKILGNKFHIKWVSFEYQKNRVENVCERLNLNSLTYLWEMDQPLLLNQMIEDGINGILIKVYVIGLDKIHLMKSLKEMKNKLMKLEDEYGINLCDEGGEYETMIFDYSKYKKKIVIDEFDIICHSKDIYSPVYYSVVKKWHLEDKNK